MRLLNVCRSMGVVPMPGLLLRRADTHEPDADNSAAALESSSVGSRASTNQRSSTPQTASRSTTHATRGTEYPAPAKTLPLLEPHANCSSSVPSTQERRCAKARTRIADPPRTRNRPSPPCTQPTRLDSRSSPWNLTNWSWRRPAMIECRCP